MKINWQNILAFALLLFAVVGCSTVNQIRKEIDKSQQPRVITSSDGKSQITVPGMWKQETDLNDAATLQASHRFNELYIVSIPQSKVDFVEGFTLDQLTDNAREDVKNWVKDINITEPAAITINNRPARQFEVSGTVDNIKAKYIYTVIDAPENYYQILAWTLTSRYESNKNQLLEVINSFRENESAMPDEPPPPPAPVKSKK
jgi:hypothetical protein